MRKLIAVAFAALVAALVLSPTPVAEAAYKGSGSSLPAACTIGDTFRLLPLGTEYDCRFTNVWAPRHSVHAVARSLPDNTLTAVWSVPVAVSNSACSVHTSFTYTAVGGGNVVSHAGIAIVALTNNAGTVTGTVVDSGEAINGTGCAAGCDAWSVSVASTTATLNATFNNTLSVTGSMTYKIINNSCGPLTEF